MGKFSLIFLAFIVLPCVSIAKTPDRAFEEQLYRGIRFQDGEAAYLLGRQLIAKNAMHEEGMVLIMQAAEWGSFEAMTFILKNHNEQFPPETLKRWTFLQGANDDIAAMYEQGDFFQTGEPEEQFYFIEKAACRGFKPAMLTLVRFLKEGWGAKRNKTHAHYWMLRAKAAALNAKIVASSFDLAPDENAPDSTPDAVEAHALLMLAAALRAGEEEKGKFICPQDIKPSMP